MIIVLRHDSTESQIAQVLDALERLGLSGQLIAGQANKLVAILDDVSTLPSHLFSRLPAVERTIRLKPQCSLSMKGGSLALEFGGNAVIGGGRRPIVIAGPCSVEGQGQILSLAYRVKEAGAVMLRGGAYKPRTSPYDFQGLGEEGLRYLKEASRSTGLPVVSEVMSAEQVEEAAPYVDMFQIGARNMYNYELLKEVGRTNRPVLLKRAMSATVAELLSAAEYIMLKGNLQVVLCERGIRTFETCTRNTLDLSAVAALKTMTHLPVIVDPSHAAGRRDLVRPLARAAIACGADGLLIEVHDQSDQALSDGEQAVTTSELKDIVVEIENIHSALKPATKSLSLNPSARIMSQSGAGTV